MAVETRISAGRGRAGEASSALAVAGRTWEAGTSENAEAGSSILQVAAKGENPKRCGGARTVTIVQPQRVPEVAKAVVELGSSEDNTVVTLEGREPEGEEDRRRAKAALAKEREQALLKEQRTMNLLREVEKQQNGGGAQSACLGTREIFS